MKSDGDAELRSYWNSAFNTIEGWVHQDLLKPLEVVQQVQVRSDIRGGAIEHGDGCSFPGSVGLGRALSLQRSSIQ